MLPRRAAGSVSKVEMTTPIALICKMLFPSLSTFETPPKPAHDPHIYDLEANKSPFAKADPAPDAPAGCRSRMRCGTARGVAVPAQPAPQSPPDHPAAPAASG